MAETLQGHDFRGYYLHEDNGFNTTPNDSTYKTFGADATITRAEGSNNAVRVFEPNTRTAQDIIEQTFDGAWSADFVYTNPWWLTAFYGSPDQTDEGDGSYTYTFSGEDPQPIRIFLGREADTSDAERALYGCVAVNASISIQVPGMVRVTLTGVYADEEKTSNLQSQPSFSDDPLSFAHSTLKTAGSSVGYVQQGTLDLNANAEMVYEWGTRVAVDFAPRTFTPEFNFQRIGEKDNTDELQKMYGGTSQTTPQTSVSNESMTLTLDNGSSAGSGINKLVGNVTGGYPESYNESNIGDPEADVTEDVNRFMESISFDATNEANSAK